jgi:hypothetical protein
VQRSRWSTGARLLAACAIPGIVACGGSDAGSTSPVRRTGPASVTLVLSGLRTLDSVSEGSYQAWASDGSGGLRSLGRFSYGSSVVLQSGDPIPDGTDLLVTVEPPNDVDPAPSSQRLLRGTVHGGGAELTLVGAVTQGALELRLHPGQFTMFTPSDNALNGYPSHEESGVWLFNMQPSLTEQKDMWVRLTQLAPGWTYEGWMVRDMGASGAVWLSYGKFTPDYTGAVNKRDDTGWGPFSGVIDFRTDGEEEFPGDDWISNPLHLAMPGGLSLPLDLRETTSGGVTRWTHVISIEPSWNAGEAVGTERPFLVRPYQDSFGTTGPGIPRTITFHPENVPSARATIR